MNVNLDAKGLGEFLKELPYRFIFLLISVLSALLIFLPDSVLDKIFLLELRNKIGTFLGITFIFSVCLTIFLFVSPLIRDIRIRKALSGNSAKKKFESLSSVEKQIIAYMYMNRSSQIVLPGTNSTIVHLKTMLMISEASNLGSSVGTAQMFPYFLQQWVVNILDDNPELLRGIPPKLPREFEQFIKYIDI